MQNFPFFFCDPTLYFAFSFFCAVDEKKTAQSVRQRLWELLAPAGLTEGLGSTTWLYAYRQLLREEGADSEAQTRALLLQLWATQVSQIRECSVKET